MSAVDWEHVDLATRELLYEASDLTELLRAVNARTGLEIARSTYRDWLNRTYNEGASNFEELKARLAGLDENMGALAKLALRELRKRGHRDQWQSIIGMADCFDRSPASIKQALQELADAGYNVVLDDDASFATLPTWQEPTCQRIPVERWMDGLVYRFGIVSDTHLCNRNYRPDVLEALYDIFEAEGIKIVLHAGNILDGEFKFNRHELVAAGFEGQVTYTRRNYPRRHRITTHFITGDCHEGWFGKDIGLDVGRAMHYRFQDSEYDPEYPPRPDLQWLGHVEADLALHPDNPRSVLRIIHPGGGTAYATSYTLQKIVESYQGGEKPSVLIAGHFHKYISFYPREIYVIQPGCTEDQTSFMRKRKLGAHVGGVVAEIRMTTEGAVGWVTTRFIPFYDKTYYQAFDFASMHWAEGNSEPPAPMAAAQV